MHFFPYNKIPKEESINLHAELLFSVGEVEIAAKLL